MSRVLTKVPTVLGWAPPAPHTGPSNCSTTVTGAISRSATCVPMNSNCVTTNQWPLNPSVHAFGATPILAHAGLRFVGATITGGTDHESHDPTGIGFRIAKLTLVSRLQGGATRRRTQDREVPARCGGVGRGARQLSRDDQRCVLRFLRCAIGQARRSCSRLGPRDLVSGGTSRLRSVPAAGALVTARSAPMKPRGAGLSCHSAARRSYFTCQIKKQVHVRWKAMVSRSSGLSGSCVVRFSERRHFETENACYSFIGGLDYLT